MSRYSKSSKVGQYFRSLVLEKLNVGLFEGDWQRRHSQPLC